MHFMRGDFRPVELIKGHPCNFCSCKGGPWGWYSSSSDVTLTFILNVSPHLGLHRVWSPSRAGRGCQVGHPKSDRGQPQSHTNQTGCRRHAAVARDRHQLPLLAWKDLLAAERHVREFLGHGRGREVCCERARC